MEMKQAYDMLPAGAKWSCSFGNPGEGGFNEHYLAPDGSAWTISNGTYLDGGRNWSCEQERPHAAVLSGRIYAYAETRKMCALHFRRQISGALPAMKDHMLSRVQYVALDPEAASEAAECIDADAIAWL